eukprot:scaffold1516_cov266-Prasinococcus_capsulatus_cf.AAC.9
MGAAVRGRGSQAWKDHTHTPGTSIGGALLGRPEARKRIYVIPDGARVGLHLWAGKNLTWLLLGEPPRERAWSFVMASVGAQMRMCTPGALPSGN